MSDLVQNSAIGAGNTNSPSKKQPNPSDRWVFTLNNWTEKEYEEFIVQLVHKSKRYVVGKEIGEEGTPHLQGYFEYSCRARPSALKLTHTRTHFEKAKADDITNYAYCIKEGDYVDNFEKSWKVQHGFSVIKLIQRTNFYWWQEWIVAEFEKHEKNPNDRIIYWLWEAKGCAGKTSICKWLMTVKKFGFLCNAKSADCAYYVANNLKDGYCFNYTRSNEDKINYQVLESLKDGLLFSAKYESSTVLMDSPFIVCLANFEPDREKLSADRWKIINIGENEEKQLKKKKKQPEFNISF